MTISPNLPDRLIRAAVAGFSLMKRVLYAQAGKRHGMIKRTNKQIRNLRGTNVLFEGDAANVKKYFLPNG